MVSEETTIVTLRDDFYRDSFGKVIGLIIALCLAVMMMVGMSLYLYLSKPVPVVFPVEKEWRILKPVDLDQPYLSTPDLLQWVSDVLIKSFVLDFNHYNDQLKVAAQSFTPDGWKVFLNQLNIYANYNTVQKNKMFVNSQPAGAPFVLRQGLLPGRRYAWWVKMPLTLNYSGYNQSSSQVLTLEVLVVRVSTLNNLMGVGIDNVIVENSAKEQKAGNG